jgi:hypothetical protein
MGYSATRKKVLSDLAETIKIGCLQTLNARLAITFYFHIHIIPKCYRNDQSNITEVYDV